jgi:hypothetical protein
MSDAQQAPKPRRRWLWYVMIAGCIGTAVALAAKALFRNQFPYGYSHSCTKGLGLGLRIYANDHGGWWPHGGRTPEESLSFACTNDDSYALKNLMGGKHIPQVVVDAAFAKDGVLSPASCGWHYVEGLRKDDALTGLAVAWDKMSGLDHNGRLRKDFEREVVMLDGSSQMISKKKWPEFCATQQALIAKAIAIRTRTDPPIRWSDESALGPNRFPPPSRKTN